MKTQSSSQPFSKSPLRFTQLASLVFATIAALLIPTVAHAQAATAPGTRVAVIDISYIFKNHPGFKTAMEGMKTDVQAFEGTLRQRGEQMKTLQGQLAQYKPTSQEYKNIEAQILKINADGQAAATLKKKDFLQREAEIYFQTYNEIAAEVASLAEKHGLGLVVRFNSEPITNERPAILEGVNRAVVYQKNLNITFAVLENLKRRVAQPGGAGAPAARTATPGAPAATR